MPTKHYIVEMDTNLALILKNSGQIKILETVSDTTVLCEGKAPRLTHKMIKDISEFREEVRRINGGDGMCHEVSEWIEGEYGWERVDGTYCARNGDVICSPHYWNRMPDGSILDATADQFGEGNDIRIIRPNDPEQKRYRPEWYSEYHPDDPHYDPNHPRDGWTGELDYDASERLQKERGDGWWVTDKEGHDRFWNRMAEYKKQDEERYKRR